MKCEERESLEAAIDRVGMNPNAAAWEFTPHEEALADHIATCPTCKGEKE